MPGAQVGRPPGWDENPPEAHTWPGTSGHSLPPHHGLSKTPAVEEQTAMWLVDHLLGTETVCARSLDPPFVMRSAARLSVTPASSPRSQQMPPVLCSASHSPAAKSGLQVTAWKDDVKNREHLEGRRAFLPTSHHTHPHLPFCFLYSDQGTQAAMLTCLTKKSVETSLDWAVCLSGLFLITSILPGGCVVFILIL